MSNLSAVTPLRLRLLDGEELEFLLTFGALRRAQRLIAGLEPGDNLGMASAMLWAACLNRPDVTQEQFEDLLPANITEFVSQLAEASGLNPTKAETAEVTPIRKGRKAS